MTKTRSANPGGGGSRGHSPSRKRWTEEEDAALIEMWLSHMPLGNIAAKMGRTRSALQTRASWLGLPLSTDPDAYPDGKMKRCQGCRRTFFSKMRGHRFCNPCKRNWPSGAPDDFSSTFLD